MYACVIPGLVYFNIMITVSEVMGNVIYTCRQIKNITALPCMQRASGLSGTLKSKNQFMVPNLLKGYILKTAHPLMFFFFTGPI